MSKVPRLDVQNLTVEFHQATRPPTVAVNKLSLSLNPNETLGIIGGSGCGKTTLALSILRLLSQPPAKITEGSILLNGQDLLQLSEKEMRSIRGRQISMVFQEPLSSLNPVLTAGEQVIEALRCHRRISRHLAKKKTLDLFHQVRLPSPEVYYQAYPHQLSGGMRQRVLLAQALAGNPSLLIADEPTASLDLFVQRQFLLLIRDLQCQTGLSVLLISHDLPLVADVCDRVLVMEHGHSVECAPTPEILNSPQHPYTVNLMKAASSLYSMKYISTSNVDGAQ